MYLEILRIAILHDCCIFFAGFQPDISKFLLFYLTLCLTTIGGAAIAFTFSALVSVFAVAHLLVSLIFVFYMVRRGKGEAKWCVAGFRTSIQTGERS